MSHPAIVKDNVAVITGGASGIGFAAAAAFARTGMKLCIADVDQPRLAEAATKLSSVAGAGNVMTSAVDVSKVESVMELERAVCARFGGTDILMNMPASSPAAHCSPGLTIGSASSASTCGASSTARASSRPA